MSIVVMYKGVMASDSQFLIDTRKASERVEFGPKLFKGPGDKFVIGGCGAVIHPDDLQALHEVLFQRLSVYYAGFDPDNPLEFSVEESQILLPQLRDGNIPGYRYLVLMTAEHQWALTGNSDDVITVMPHAPGEYHCIGSENNMANTAYTAGLDAVDIVELVCKLTNTCGGATQSVSQTSLKKFPRTAVKRRARK